MSEPFARRLLKVYRLFRRDCVASLTRLKGTRNVLGEVEQGHTPRKEIFRKVVLGTSIGALGTCGALLYFLDSSVKAYELLISIPTFPWTFEKIGFHSFDHSALRRGWVVYKNVCSSCHSLQYLSFRELVGVTHTTAEVKAIAEEYEVDDGPDSEGNYFKRLGKLSDRVPNPYPNEEAARAANGGAHPPDLSYVVRARWNGINYVFALLTGYMDPPAGVTLADGQSFNPYFAGGALGMAEMFSDGLVDYDDGTPATCSQMAKDIVEFLCWTSSQEHDTRKLMLMKAMGICLILFVCLFHIHRRYTSFLRSRQIMQIPKSKRQ